MGYIYMLTDTRNGKKYIGQHDGSKKSYWSGGLIPNRIADKYGKDIFVRVILEDEIPKNLLSDREKFYIKKYNTITEGYNLTEGGDGGDTISNNPNKEDIVQKIKESSKNRIFSNEHRKKLKDNHMSKNPLNRQKLSEALKGKTKTEEHKLKISESTKNYNKLIGRWSGDDNPLKNEKIKEKISKLNKERGIKRRKENLENFIQDFNNGLINEYNISKYKYKIWYWKKDLGSEIVDKLIPQEVMESFDKLSNQIKEKNIKLRIEDSIGFKHKEESKKKISESHRKEFLNYCENIFNTILKKKQEYLIDTFNKEEYFKIRKKIKSSKFINEIPKELKDKILNIKNKKVKKELQSNKFYGNKNKNICIDGILFKSVSEASQKLNINRSTIRHRLKSSKYLTYIYN